MSEISELVSLKGRLEIVVKDETTGEIKDQREVDNLIVTAGKSYIASRMVGTSASVIGYMALGTGTASAVVGDTALGSEISGSRTALTSYTSSGAVATAVATFGAGVGTGAVTEAGLFNASTAGTMLCRTVFSVVNKGANDSMTITWTQTIQ